MDKFAQDLAAEVSQDGVIVQSVFPGLVATKMSNLKGQASTFVPSPVTFVSAHLRTLGIETRTAPYWTHRITVIQFINKTHIKIIIIIMFLFQYSCI